MNVNNFLLNKFMVFLTLSKCLLWSDITEPAFLLPFIERKVSSLSCAASWLLVTKKAGRTRKKTR